MKWLNHETEKREEKQKLGEMVFYADNAILLKAFSFYSHSAAFEFFLVADWLEILLGSKINSHISLNLCQMVWFIKPSSQLDLN